MYSSVEIKLSLSYSTVTNIYSVLVIQENVQRPKLNVTGNLKGRMLNTSLSKHTQWQVGT